MSDPLRAILPGGRNAATGIVACVQSLDLTIKFQSPNETTLVQRNIRRHASHPCGTSMVNRPKDVVARAPLVWMNCHAGAFATALHRLCARGQRQG